MTPVSVCVAGASGRMGQMLLTAVREASGVALGAALDRPDSALIGHDAGELIGHAFGVPVQSDAGNALKHAQVLIDFTRPEATLRYLGICRELGVRMVIGTTGFSEAQRNEIAAASQSMGIVFAPNMSVGVTAMMKLARLAAVLLREGYDFEVVEAHHSKKVDAPSGTALGLGRALAEGLGKPLEEVAVFERFGDIGARKPGTIGFATVRGGDIVGDHTVLFAGTGERIEITHRAQSRATYAQGALRAARFVADKVNGLYDMRDVLGLR